MTEEVLSEFQPEIESFTLIPGDGGRFELVINGELLYSKIQTKRHVEEGEVHRIIREYLNR